MRPPNHLDKVNIKSSAMTSIFEELQPRQRLMKLSKLDTEMFWTHCSGTKFDHIQGAWLHRRQTISWKIMLDWQYYGMA